MNIQISETNNGFFYDKKFYNWGDELINLANSDFSKIKNLILVEEPKDKTYLEFFKPFLDLKFNSLHFKFICSSFIKYLEFYDESFERNFYNELIYEPLLFLNDVHNIYYSLSHCQKQAKEILSCFIDEAKKNRRLNNRAKFKRIYNKNPLNVSFNYETKITQFDLNNFSPNFTMDLKGNTIIQCHFFSSIPDFCNYELYKFIEKNIKVAKCDCCDKFIRIKNANTRFCSEECRQLYNNSNPFKTAYRTRYKNFSNKHYGENCPEPFDTDLRPKITKLYYKYKDYWQTENEESKLEEFKQKLKQFK